MFFSDAVRLKKEMTNELIGITTHQIRDLEAPKQKPGMDKHTCNASYSICRGKRIPNLRPNPAKGSKTPSQKQNGYGYSINGRVLA
jgi:hypothetical protein